MAYCDWAALPPEALVKSHPVLPRKAMSGSEAIQQPRSVLMSMSLADVTTKDHADISGLSCGLGPC